MTDEIKKIIKKIILDSYNVQLNDDIAIHSYRRESIIGTEVLSGGKRVSVKVPRTGKNGRIYYHTELKFPTHIYTREMYEEELLEVLSRNHHWHQFKVAPDDSMKVIYIKDHNNPGDAIIEDIYNSYSPYYRDKLIGFTIKRSNFCGKGHPETYAGVFPIFTGEANTEFYDSMNSYCSKKAEWCSKYGCD